MLPSTELRSAPDKITLIAVVENFDGKRWTRVDMKQNYEIHKRQMAELRQTLPAMG